VSHYRCRMRLARTTLLPCSMARLIPELAKPMLLNWISWPFLHVVAVDPPRLPERFGTGRYRTRLRLGGLLPIGEHVIDLQPGPAAGPGVVAHDAGHGDLVRTWDHKIRLADFHGMTRYTDEVEIRAGLLTVPIWLFAYAYYAHRQRRLNRLVGSGFAY
jgi:hypothetical protein